MGILQIITDEPSQINIPNIRRVKIITTDSLAAVIAPGYLNPDILQGYYIFNTDVIDVWYNATGNANFITSPGIYIRLQPNINNGVIILNPSNQVLVSVVTLNQSQILNAYTNPVLLIPSPGPGYAIILNRFVAYVNFNITPFAGGGSGKAQYGNAPFGAGLSTAGLLSAATINSSVSTLSLLTGINTSSITSISNDGIYFSNATGPFTGGSKNSTVTFTLTYQIFSATV